MEKSLETLENSKNVCIVAPAGYGKTHLIAESVKYSEGGKQLILTHTHAGVRALKDKLVYLGVPSKKYNVETISGFALKFVYAYPKGSGVCIEKPTETNEWNQIHEGATRLLEIPAMKNVITISYKGLYVDEYQDCTIQQHNFIIKLKEILPCRILGDPLQGIFDFKDSEIVDWDRDVYPNFQRLPDLEIPHRWKNENPVLGEWLREVRNRLLYKQELLLNDLPISITWLTKKTQQDTILYLYKLANKKGSIASIYRGEWWYKCPKLASSLKGKFQSMEEIESKDLFKWSKNIEMSDGFNRINNLIEFSKSCIAGVIEDLRGITKCVEKGKITPKYVKFKPLYDDFYSVLQTNSLKVVLEILSKTENMDKAILYRRELWNTMIKSIKEYNTGKYNSLYDAAWAVRNIDRKIGRKVDYRCISRTLLIKGLEFDHAIVLDADDMNYKELYVALTRGSKSLTIISQSNILHPKYN